MSERPIQPGLAAALAALQSEIPAVTKTKTAKVKGKSKNGVEFDYTYKYADLADVTAAVMPLMGSHGLSFTCAPTIRDDGRFGLAYQLLHASGELIDGFYPLDDSMTPQQIGGHITYARRYCLCAVTGIAAEEDTDARGADSPPARRAPRGKPPERPSDALPRNRDGSTSRSQVTDDELAATGQMTDAELRAHNRLERDVKGTGPQGAQRLTATPEDDEFYLTPVRTPQAAPSKAQAIVMHFDRLKFTDRDERLKATSAIIGRQVTSTNDLTAAEGIEVANLLGKCKNRDALIEHLAVKAGEDTA